MRLHRVRLDASSLWHSSDIFFSLALEKNRPLRAHLFLQIFAFLNPIFFCEAYLFFVFLATFAFGLVFGTLVSTFVCGGFCSSCGISSSFFVLIIVAAATLSVAVSLMIITPWVSRVSLGIPLSVTLITCPLWEVIISASSSFVKIWSCDMNMRLALCFFCQTGCIS